MRVVATIFAGILCIAGFLASLFVHSILSYATDADAVTDTARTSDLHGMAVRAGQEALAVEMRKSAKYSRDVEEFALGEAGAVLREVVDATWFYASFARGYREVIAVLSDTNGPADPIDLSTRRQRLQDGFLRIADKMEKQCSRLFGRRACRDSRAGKQTRADYEAAVARALANIPDSLDLARETAHAGKDWLDANSPAQVEVRRVVDILEMTRVAALGLLAIGLLLVVVVNSAPTSQLLLAVGAVISLSAVAYLVAVNIGDTVITDRVFEERLEQRAGLTPRDDPVGDLAVRAAETMTVNAIRDAIHKCDDLALGILMAGIAAIGLGVFAGRSSHRRPGE
ncbi:MAG: hypothetical protein MJE77_38580 [Proteobacteria bacterium]|nr:hypothetical protein [Pseudomonadota bacterium]